MSAFKLIVTVVDVKELSVTNGAVVNPVAQILCGNKKKKTKTKAIKPTQPHWNETFEFPFEGDAHEIVVRIVDVKGFNRKSVGQCVIDLKDESILSQVNTEKEIVHDLSDGRAVVGKIKLRCKLTQGVQSKSGGRQPPRVQVPQMSRKNIRQKGSCVLPIFEFIRTRDYVGLVEFLQTATPEEVNAQLPKSRNTPLHEACIEREEEILNALLKFHVINLNLKNSDDNTPLHYFCEKWQSPDYLESFTLFIKQGADVNAANSNGETPIFKAIFNNSIRYLLMEALIRNNADVNITTKTAKEGVLHYAVRLGRADLVDLILQARPRLDLKGEEGYTPQELAEVYHHQKIALHLKEVGALFEWLDDNDLSEHKGRFVKNEMTLSLLPHMKDDMLHQMGVESVGARMKILKACEKLECPPAGLPAAPKTCEAISEDRLNSLENDLRDIDTSGEGIIDGKLIEYTKHLGTGASGDVWKGIFNKVPVAIKVLRVTAEQEIDEFKKEFEVMRTVRNNHVVRFYGASMKPRLCMVMEYCARGSLFHVMKEPSADIGWDMAVGFCKEMCLGLQALHNNVPLILHRDLKSLNLLVTQDWHIKLCDFGLSRFATPENLDTMKVLRGTFAYCDPEVYNGKIFSAASDIYSLGIITWEIVNRVIKGNYEQPYAEYKNLNFDFQIIIEAAKADLRPTVPDGCPSAYEALIRLCWHKAQGARPTLAQMVMKLEEMECEIGKWNI